MPANAPASDSGMSKSAWRMLTPRLARSSSAPGVRVVITRSDAAMRASAASAARRPSLPLAPLMPMRISHPPGWLIPAHQTGRAMNRPQPKNDECAGGTQHEFRQWRAANHCHVGEYGADHGAAEQQRCREPSGWHQYKDCTDYLDTACEMSEPLAETDLREYFDHHRRAKQPGRSRRAEGEGEEDSNGPEDAMLGFGECRGTTCLIAE